MKKTIRPYIAFDLETTGVDVNNVHTLEIGAVFDDGVSPIEELKTFNVLIREEVYHYAEPYAMQLNYQVLKEIATKKSSIPILRPGEAMLSFQGFCENASPIAKQWDQNNGASYATPSFSFAGKNASSFDFPILHTMLARLLKMDIKESGVDPEVAAGIVKAFTIGTGFLKRRFIDLGSVYYDDFGYIPSQDEIMTFLGWEKVNHRAKDDAMQVVRAIRNKWENKHG